MWTAYLFEITRFAICLFTALVLFATFWLYLDAWNIKRTPGGFVRCIGFLILSLSFVISAVMMETSLLHQTLFNYFNMDNLQLILRSLGYLGIFVGALWADKLQARPKVEKNEKTFALPFMIIPVVLLHLLPPVLALVVGSFYVIRTTIGLEAHMKKVSAAFFFLAIFETLSLTSLFQNTSNITLYQFVAPFGPLWIFQYFVLTLATLILGKWVFGYLLKQFEPQLFMTLSSLILIIFLVTTTVFTGLLLRNIQSETTRQLHSDVQVLQYALESKRTEATADVQILAQNANLQKHLQEKSRVELANTAEQLLLSKKYTSLIVTDDKGQIVARGEDKENSAGFLASDPLIKRVLTGQALSAFSTTEGVIAPEILLRAAAPIKVNDQLIGAVMIGNAIDNVFVDGMKKATGLEASLYGDNTLSATTLLSSDNKTRLSGVKENNAEIGRTVLDEGKTYSGEVTIGNTQYFAANAPLMDADNNPVGMLFVGREQLGVLQTASRSIELTFIATAIMLVLSFVPSYFISRSIARQIG